MLTRCRRKSAPWPAAIIPTPVDENLVTSKALTLVNGTVASGGSRHETDVIALYEFKAGRRRQDI